MLILGDFQLVTLVVETALSGNCAILPWISNKG